MMAAIASTAQGLKSGVFGSSRMGLTANAFASLVDSGSTTADMISSMSMIPHATPLTCQLRHVLRNGRIRPNGVRLTLLIARFCPHRPFGR